MRPRGEASFATASPKTYGIIAIMPWWIVILLIIVIPVSVLMLVLIGIARFIKGLWLGVLVRLTWFPRHTYGVVVMSGHPTWEPDIEKIQKKSDQSLMILRWEEKTKWNTQSKLAVSVLKLWLWSEHIYGQPNHPAPKNVAPGLVIFKPWWRPTAINLYHAYHRHNKNNSDELTSKLTTITKLLS